MSPLLRRDGHLLSYFVLQAFFIFQGLSFATSTSSASSSVGIDDEKKSIVDPPPAASRLAQRIVEFFTKRYTLQQRLIQLSLFGTLLFHLFSCFYTPPSRYPDLHEFLVAIYSAGHFFIFYIVINLQQWSIPLEETEDEDFKRIGRVEETTEEKRKRL